MNTRFQGDQDVMLYLACATIRLIRQNDRNMIQVYSGTRNEFEDGH